MIERQPIQPGANRRVPLEAPQLAVRLEEDFLEEIFPVFRGSRHPACQCVKPGRVLMVEGLERLDVARLALGDEFLRAHRCFFRREGERGALLAGGHFKEYERGGR
jgi:hypothetical protein